MPFHHFAADLIYPENRRPCITEKLDLKPVFEIRKSIT